MESPNEREDIYGESRNSSNISDMFFDLFNSTVVAAHENRSGLPSDSSFGEEFDPAKHHYPEEQMKVVSTAEAVFKITFYVLTILVSIVGNGLVIFVVWRNIRMRTTTNYYIVNLAVADLLVTLTCSWVHLVDDMTEGWVLEAFFCKINTFSQVLALVSSILTLTLIACDRFFGIVFAMKAHLTERRATTCILIVWVCAFVVSSPLLAYRGQQTRQWANHLEIWCDDTWPAQVSRNQSGIVLGVSHPSRLFYYTFVSVVLFFLPIVVMTTAYSVIVWKLWSTSSPGEQIQSGKVAQDRVKRKVAIMLVVLLLIFVLCWLPLIVSILYNEYRQQKYQPLPQWFPAFKYVATFVAFSNSALNPIIYAGFNNNFQKAFASLFRGSRRVSRQYSSVGGSSLLHRESSFQNKTMVTII